MSERTERTERYAPNFREVIAQALEFASLSDGEYDLDAITESLLAAARHDLLDLRAAERELAGLRERLATEIETRRDRAAEERDRMLNYKSVLEADRARAKAAALDADTDRLQALLDTEAESAEEGES